jgi:UTP-glucose-1-phosphate uridylyltransferase
VSDKAALVIIAAGMGSRYGGLKQIDPVGPNGELIIDYSIYDALRAGFTKIVFIIRHDFEEAFHDKIGRRLENRVETAYAYQELDSCLNGFPVPENRQKPWGTGHAILTARDVIHEAFAVINADDYYGRHAYALMKEQLKKMSADKNHDEYAMVGYILRNTLSEYGTVARGVCQSTLNQYLAKVTERPRIRKNGTGAVFIDEQGLEHPLTGDEIVSMNLWGFTPDIFDFLQQQFCDYLREHGRENKSEFYIPSVVDRLVQNQQKKVRLLKTDDAWFGVTYREDKEPAQQTIRTLIKQNIYPECLWDNMDCKK